MYRFENVEPRARFLQAECSAFTWRLSKMYDKHGGSAGTMQESELDTRLDIYNAPEKQ
jgi:hypothetical protein